MATNRQNGLNADSDGNNASAQAYDVLLFDPYFCDLIVTGLPELPRLGLDLFGTGMGIEAGGTFNTVRALHRLGMNVGWACDFGNDLFSQFVLSEIAKEGADSRLFRVHDQPVRSFSLAFSYAHDRGFISFMDPLTEADRRPYVYKHRPKAILMNVLETERSGIELAQAAHEVGALVYLDSQSTDKALSTPGVVEMLGAADVLLINSSEAMLLTAAPSRDEAGERLAEVTPLVVLKSGAEGAFAYRKGKSPVYAPAIKVEVVDTTGAGDCFNAGFIAGQLRGEPLKTRLRLGNICGGLSTSAYGTTATPMLETALRYLSALDNTSVKGDPAEN